MIIGLLIFNFCYLYSLLNNSEYTLLLRQKPSIIEQIEKTFKLSQQEKDRLLTAKTGEGIIIISNEHSEIKIIASPEEHQVITTNADERLKKERKKANKVITDFKKPTLDFKKGWFKKKDLEKEQIDDLLKRGYRSSFHIGLEGGQRQEFLLKPRSNESCEHFFVIKIIEECIKEHTDKVWLYETKHADIVFEVNGKKIGIEIETGSMYNKMPEELLKKAKDCSKKYDDWFFVVTNVKKYKDKYKKLGKTYARREVPDLIESYFLTSENEEKQQISQNSNLKLNSEDLSVNGTQNPPGNRDSEIEFQSSDSTKIEVGENVS